MHRSKLVPFVVGIGALSFFGLGCNPVATLEKKAGEKVAEGIVGAASGGKVKIDDNTVVFKDNKTGDIASYGENVKLPDEFPKDVPFPSGVKFIGVNTSKEQKTSSATFDSTEDISKIVDFYKNAMEKDGWKESQSLSANGVEIRAYEKGTLKISFTAGPKEDGGTTATVVRTDEK